MIGAKTLSEGVDYVKSTLGVDIPFGGEHLTMGTHNHLMQLGSDTFLEVIAVNETIAPPAKPRWYGLDDPYIRHRLEKQPCLLTWVVNTHNLDALIKNASFSLGRSESVSRGNLSWNFGLPEDGRIFAGGILPYAIEWHTQVHPSRNMLDTGCHIQGLDIYHPYPDWLESALLSIGASQLVSIHKLGKHESPYFSVEIATPSGNVQLHSCIPSDKY